MLNALDNLTKRSHLVFKTILLKSNIVMLKHDLPCILLSVFT